MSIGTSHRIFGRTSLVLAVAAILAPVIGYLTISHDWAAHDMSIALMAEGFVVTMFSVVAAGFFALCALIAAGIGLARKEPDRWASGVGLTLGGLVMVGVLVIASIVYSSSGKTTSGAAAPASQPASVPK